MNLRLENGSEGLYIIHIMDMSGRVVLSKDHFNTANSIYHTLSLEKLNTGKYIIRLVCPDGSQI